jgi:hypothetical protein
LRADSISNRVYRRLYVESFSIFFGLSELMKVGNHKGHDILKGISRQDC